MLAGGALRAVCCSRAGIPGRQGLGVRCLQHQLQTSTFLEKGGEKKLTYEGKVHEGGGHMRTASKPGLTRETPRGEGLQVVDTCGHRVGAQVDLLKQGNTWSLSLFQIPPRGLCVNM